MPKSESTSTATLTLHEDEVETTLEQEIENQQQQRVSVGCIQWLEKFPGNLLDLQSNKVIVNWPKSVRKFPSIQSPFDLQWSPAIAEYLVAEDLRHVATCQSVTWRAVSRLHSVVTIGGPGQGKSLGK